MYHLGVEATAVFTEYTWTFEFFSVPPPESYDPPVADD